MSQFKNTGIAWIWIAILVFIFDQVTKIAVLQNFALYESVKITDFFNLIYVQNFGAAFSFLADHNGWQRWFFTAIAIFAVGLISYWLTKTEKNKLLLCIGFNLILGGALGNLYDRVAYGFVVDFLDFTIPLYGRWPAFNIADMGIVIGAGLILLDSFKNPENAEQDKKEQTAGK
ncbi:signal peptidase II [Catenovulum maritimum]|uniref:Lipoprotein signal peptidase n=1 Tax=Catenovulum maritimum TaxID=1513271 RepID=A0A0J8GW29_9ALTE|nr:signal peptidase II [Catenovulum maritimum]KMT64883.1 lipoprotein signal peptidase [Catenovulum maritimum]